MHFGLSSEAAQRGGVFLYHRAKGPNLRSLDRHTPTPHFVLGRGQSLLPLEETNQASLAQNGPVDSPLEGSSPARTDGDAEEPANPKQMKVLLVEDHDLNRELLLEMLTLSGFESLGANCAAKALVLLNEHTFDVVLMDLHLPGMDGAKLTREWRKIEIGLGRSPVRIVGISADTRVGERQRCIVAGMNGFLGKPFSLAELKQALSESSV